MKNKTSLFFAFFAFFFAVIIFKQFDFVNFKFKKLGLGIVYFITFIFSVFMVIKNRKNKD
jgi:hypothetical protein